MAKDTSTASRLIYVVTAAAVFFLTTHTGKELLKAYLPPSITGPFANYEFVSLQRESDATHSAFVRGCTMRMRTCGYDVLIERRKWELPR
jgi:hypothetical protein